MRLRKSAVPFGSDDHTVKNYFPVPIPNAVFTLGLSTGALVAHLYMTRHQKKGMPSVESLGKALGKSVRTVTGYLQELEKHGVVCDGQKAKGNFFLMPKAIFDLGLSVGTVATYAYLMRCENRESHQCWPSMATIGIHIGRARKSVMAYVRELEKKQLIYTEHSTVWGKGGQKRNANLIYTIRPIADVLYDGDCWSLTALAKHLLGVKWAMAGPRYFKYKGEWLNTIRERLGV